MTRRKFLLGVVGLIVLFICFLINLIFVFISEDNILNVIFVHIDIIAIIICLVSILLKKQKMIKEYQLYLSNKELVEQLERIYKKKSLCGNINNIFSKEDEAFLKLVLRELIKRCQEMSKNNSKWYAKKYKELLKRLEKIKTTYN